VYISKNVPASPSAYVKVTLTGINVTNGSCQINLTSDAKAGNWAYFDDVTLVKQ
jgi:arabinogalactan endo-1,4-beta-galactosidase